MQDPDGLDASIKFDVNGAYMPGMRKGIRRCAQNSHVCRRRLKCCMSPGCISLMRVLGERARCLALRRVSVPGSVQLYARVTLHAAAVRPLVVARRAGDGSAGGCRV